MIDNGEIVIKMGDLRLFAQVEDGRLVDLCTVNDLEYVSRDDDELRWAIERANGAAMFLRGAPGARSRELSGHERMWIMSQLLSRGE